MPHFGESDLVLHDLPMSHKKEARLIWVNREIQNYHNFIC